MGRTRMFRPLIEFFKIYHNNMKQSILVLDKLYLSRPKVIYGLTSYALNTH